MTVKQEWYSTTHPSFSVTKQWLRDVADEYTEDEENRQVMVISADEAGVITGDLEEFAAKTVLAVFGVPMRKVFGMWQESVDGAILHWMPVLGTYPLTASEKRDGWRLGWRWVFESVAVESEELSNG